MKKIIFLALLCLFSLNICSQGKWDYPVKPGSDKWKSFITYTEMVEACRIPSEILNKMTTKELLEVYEKFPLKLIYLSFNSSIKGFENQFEISSALDEIAKRTDAGEIILNRYKELKQKEEQILKLKNNEILPSEYYLFKLMLSHPKFLSKIKNKNDMILLTGK